MNLELLRNAKSSRFNCILLGIQMGDFKSPKPNETRTYKYE